MIRLAFDIEGDGLREVRLGAKGKIHDEVSKVHCLCIRDLDTKQSSWFFDDTPEGRPLIYSGTLLDGWGMLMSADLTIAHNGIDYDMPVLRRLVAPEGHDVSTEPKLVDTLIWSRFLYPDRINHPNNKFGLRPNSLEAWGKRLKVNKLEHAEFDRLSAKMLVYCDQDVVVDIAIFQHLLPLMQRWKIQSRLEHEVARIITRQSCNGVGFDMDGAMQFNRDLLVQRAEAYDTLMQIFPPTITEMKRPVYWTNPETGKSYKKKGSVWAKERKLLVPGPVQFKVNYFNPGSDQQIVTRLTNKYGWKPTVRTTPSHQHPDGQVKVSEDILSELEWPEAALLIRYNMVEMRLTMLNDWISRAHVSRDGRVHGMVNTCGTPTARMTHSQPNQTQVTKVICDKETGDPILGYMGRWGFESRRLFRPRDGWVQVGADAIGLELCMLANRTYPFDGGEYAKILIEHDVHEYNMEQIVLLQTRPQSKETFYAGIYGAGVWKQGTVIMRHKSLTPKMKTKYKGMSAETVGTMFKEQLNESIPSLGKTIDRCKQWCRQRGYLILLDGRRAPIRSQHLALNTQLQGDGSVLCKVALVLADRRIRREVGRPLGEWVGGQWEWMINAHDEMQAEAHPDVAEQVGKIMAWAYSEAGRRLKCLIPTPGEYKIGKNWAETH